MWFIASLLGLEALVGEEKPRDEAQHGGEDEQQTPVAPLQYINTHAWRWSDANTTLWSALMP